MRTEQLKSEIKDCQIEIAKSQEQLNEIRKNIIALAKPFVKEKLRDFVENEVKGQPEHTKSLDISTLKKMKSTLTELLENSDSLVDEKFDNDHYWPHANYTGQTKCGEEILSINSRNVEYKIDSAFKELFGLAGKILSDYEYVKVSYGDSYWVFTSGANSEITYRLGISYWGTDLEDLRKNYYDVFSKLHDHMINLRKLKIELSQQEAADLWEQI